MGERKVNSNAGMVAACNEDNHFRKEKILDDHALVRVFSGGLKVIQADRSYIFSAGDTMLLPRNQLATLIMYAENGKPYRSVVVQLTTALLRAYYTKNTFAAVQPQAHGVVPLDKNPLLDGFFASVQPYFELENKLPGKLAAVKVEEAVEILRSMHPNIDGILADFSEPGKIDLVDFMEKNYMFNIPLEKFSTLTGRSLTTFNRDFRKAFDTTPQKWLTQKRLELAHYELSQKGRKPVDVYYETGFENLSHFSYAFKKRFGYSPTSVGI